MGTRRGQKMIHLGKRRTWLWRGKTGTKLSARKKRPFSPALGLLKKPCPCRPPPPLPLKAKTQLENFLPYFHKILKWWQDGISFQFSKSRWTKLILSRLILPPPVNKDRKEKRHRRLLRQGRVLKIVLLFRTFHPFKIGFCKLCQQWQPINALNKWVINITANGLLKPMRP